MKPRESYEAHGKLRDLQSDKDTDPKACYEVHRVTQLQSLGRHMGLTASPETHGKLGTY